jgi:hypothetical protein
MAPSCSADRAPPGKTWALAKEEDVRTRWRRRIWFVGEIKRTLPWSAVECGLEDVEHTSH